ncbi:hypothetical protein QJS10_CPA01g01775 [Acorus calamus]|uniref:Uncharacterized protein n=1 Tax=Acorus calamus TaxID=4465 RepID=A0AAV9FGZ2_ACOCL|nr:hypothetical protein QJS10_CPA01g01775 [Acorus calamus]
MVTVLPRQYSDHAPLELNTQLLAPKGHKPFRFERFWFERPELANIVYGSWQLTPKASPMNIIHHKLNILRGHLRSWNKTQVGDLPTRVVEAHQRLGKLIEADQSEVLPSVPLERIRQATNELTALQR